MVSTFATFKCACSVITKYPSLKWMVINATAKTGQYKLGVGTRGCYWYYTVDPCLNQVSFQAHRQGGCRLWPCFPVETVESHPVSEKPLMLYTHLPKCTETTHSTSTTLWKHSCHKSIVFVDLLDNYQLPFTKIVHFGQPLSIGLTQFYRSNN